MIKFTYLNIPIRVGDRWEIIDHKPFPVGGEGIPLRISSNVTLNTRNIRNKNEDAIVFLQKHLGILKQRLNVLYVVDVPRWNIFWSRENSLDFFLILHIEYDEFEPP